MAIPLTDLVVSIIGENRQILQALKEVEVAKERALRGEGDSGLQRDLEQLARVATEASRKLVPLEAQARETARELQSLGVAIKTGAVSVQEGAKRYAALEAVLKAQVGALNKTSTGYTGLSRMMKAAGEEGRKLEALNKSLNTSYKTDDLTRYARGLTDVLSAERAGLTSKRDAITQLKSYQSALAQQTGALERNTAEHRAVVKVMGETGAAIKRLEGDADRLEASFRGDALSRFAGEFRQIDAAVKSGTSGFAEAAARVDKLSAELREQQSQLGTTGREFDQLSRLLQSAATQQERYQRAAEQAQRANDAGQIRTYGNELKQLEGQLRSATVELGRLDAQQRSIRYDAAGVTQYRQQTELLQGSFTGIGRGLGELQTRLQTYARGLSEGSREHAELTRVLQATEKATQSLTAQQERAGAAYRSADLSQFVARLREIEAAQRSGVTTSEQAARAVQQVEAEFKEYAAALGVTGRELGTFATRQREAGQSAEGFAGAQERAQRAFDVGALRSFVAELQDAVRGYQLGETGAVEFTRAVSDSQARLREYGSTLDQNSREFAELNRVLELSERALTELSTAAERSSKGFDPAPIERFTGELERLDAAQKDLGNGLTDLAGASDRLSGSFDGSRLTDFRTEIERLIAAQRDGRATFDETGRAVQEVQTRFRDYVATLSLTAREQETLNRALDGVDSALTEVGQAAVTAARGFDPAPIRTYTGELTGLQGAGRELGSAFSGIEAELDQLDASLRDSGSAANLSARELTALQNVERELEGATARLIGEQGKLEAAFKSDALKQFRTDLEQIVTANRNGVTSFDQTARAVEALQGRIREFGSSTQLTVREQGELTRVLGQTETATRNLASAQERAQGSLQAEQLVRYNATLLDLKRSLEAGTISQEQFSAGARELATSIERSRAQVEQGGRAYVGYTQALTRVDSSLAQAEGRVRTFGVASGVSAGLTDQMQNVLFRFGAAGEAASVAMMSVSGSMAGAATSARLLNVALAVGLVGAIIGTAVAAKTLFDTSKQLDTSMTDVGKSTGFTREELLGLTRELQQVSLATGTPTDDLLKLAAVAGQMGVTGVENVAAFTKALDILTVTTDVIGEAGAQQLAGFINVTKQANVSTAESAALVTNVLVALGNSVAGGEAKILAMAQRLGVLKSAASLSQPDILGLAGGFVDLGLTAERAEISVTSTFTAIGKAASQGGEKLEVFARASGMTATEFQKLAKESPTDAFLALVGGLREAQDAGQDLNPVLDQIAGNNNTLRNVLLTLVGGYDNLNKAVNTAREESVQMSAAQEELANRMASLDGVSDRIVRVFGLLKNEMALRLIPTFSGALTGILDFSRALAGLEADARAVGTFATSAGLAFRQFAIGMDDSSRAAQSLAGQLGGMFGVLGGGLDTAYSATTGAGLATGDYIRQLLGLPPVLARAADATGALGTAEQERARALSSLGSILSMGESDAAAYLQRLEQTVSVYPQLTAELQPLIDRTRAHIESMREGGDAASEAGGKLEALSRVQDTYNNLQSLALPQAQTFLANLRELRDTYPGLAAQLNPVIDATKRHIETLKEGGGANAAHADSLEGLRKKREELVATYDAAPIGSAAQAEAEQAIRAIDGQIKANDTLSVSYEDATMSAEEYAQKLREMGPLLTDLTTRFRTTKLKLEVDGDPQEAMQRLRFIAENAGAAAAQALREGKLDRAEALLGIESEVRAEMERVKTVIREEAAQIGAAFDPAQQGANNFSDSLVRLSQAAQTQSIISSIGTYQTFTEKMLALRGATDDQAGAMYASNVAFEQNRIAAINATNSGQAYVDSIIRGSTAQWDAVLAERERANTLLTVKDATVAYGLESRITAEQMALIMTTQRDVDAALQQAEARFRLTGDAQAYATEKVQIYEGALDAMIKGGLDPSSRAFQDFAEALAVSNEELTKAERADAVAQVYAELDLAMEGAALSAQFLGAEQTQLEATAQTLADQQDAVKSAILALISLGFHPQSGAIQELRQRYVELGGNLADVTSQLSDQELAAKRAEEAQKSLGEALDLLTDGSAKTIDQVNEMRAAVDEAGAAGVITGERVRALRADLDTLEIALTVADAFRTLGEAALDALQNIPGLSDTAQAALGGLGNAAIATSDALADGQISAGDAVGVLGAAVDGVAEGFRDDLSPAAYAAVKAIDGVVDAAVKFATGDIIGGITSLISTAVNGLVDYFTESQREAEELKKIAEETVALYERLNDVLKRTKDTQLDNLETAVDTAEQLGRITEAEALIIRTQIELAELHSDFVASIRQLEKDRQDELATLDPRSATYDADVQRINQYYDGLIAAEEQGYRNNSDAIIAGGIEKAEALGIGAEEFLGGLAETDDLVKDAYAESEISVPAAVQHFGEKFGIAVDKAYDGMTDGVNLNSQGVATATTEGADGIAVATQGSEQRIAGALSERDKTLTGLLAQDNISPALRAQAEALRAEFISGANMTEAEIAAARDKVAAAIQTRQDRILELVGQGKTLAEATRIADGELATTLRLMGEEIGSGAEQGGDLAVQGIGAADLNQSDAIRKLTQNLGAEFGNVGGTVNPIISRVFGDMNTTFGSGTNLFSQGIGTGWSGLSSTFGMLGGQFGETTMSVFGQISRNIGDGYGGLNTVQTQGSSAQVAAIQRTMQAEEREFQARSADLQRQIQNSKGDERAALTREYDALKREHDAKSRAYQSAIGTAGDDEKRKIADVARLVSGGLTDMGDDEKAAAERAYLLTRQAHALQSLLYRQLMGSEADDERRAAIAAAVTTGGGLSSMASDIIGSTNTAFKNQGTAFTDRAGDYRDLIKTQSDKVKAALDAAAKIISDFKFPPLPKPPSAASAANSAFGFAGDLTSTSVDLPPTLGAFAADGLPDYSGVTSQTRAYAAATSSLFDLFDGSKRSLSLTTTQERALNLDITFTGFTAALSAPISLLERVADQMWETVRYDRETAALNRETAELWRENTQDRASRPGVKLQRKRR